MAIRTIEPSEHLLGELRRSLKPEAGLHDVDWEKGCYRDHVKAMLEEANGDLSHIKMSHDDAFDSVCGNGDRLVRVLCEFPDHPVINGPFIFYRDELPSSDI